MMGGFLAIMGIEIDAIGSLWIVIGIGGMALMIGLVMFFYANKLHPKKTFKVISKTGWHTKKFRLWYEKVPCNDDILTLMLGKIPVGFPISWFRTEYFDKSQFYIAQYAEGRIFPLPLKDKLGTVTATIKHCPKCNDSDRFWDGSVSVCDKCNEKLIFDPIVLDSVHLHRMKFNPEFETRAIYVPEVETDIGIPLAEYVRMFDVGAKIAEAITQSQMETKHVLDQQNPFMTVLLATLPLAIILIAFGFGAYIMWQGMGQNFQEGAKVLAPAAENLRIANELALNITKMRGG